MAAEERCSRAWRLWWTVLAGRCLQDPEKGGYQVSIVQIRRSHCRTTLRRPSAFWPRRTGPRFSSAIPMAEP